MTNRLDRGLKPSDNPFERYDLDPRGGIAATTQRLKELAEDARDDQERERIREAWEELTLHPARRLRAALFAHPETRPPLGAAPSLPRRRSPQANEQELGLTLRDLAARPSVLATLRESLPIDPEGKDESRTVSGEDVVPSLEDDPVLRGAP